MAEIRILYLGPTISLCKYEIYIHSCTKAPYFTIHHTLCWKPDSRVQMNSTHRARKTRSTCPVDQWVFCFPCPAFNSTFLLGKLERTSVLCHLSWKTCSQELCPKDKQTWTHTCPTTKGPLLLGIITAVHLGPIMLAVHCWNYILVHHIWSPFHWGSLVRVHSTVGFYRVWVLYL